MEKPQGRDRLLASTVCVPTAIAYLQPATRAQISQLAGTQISRDVIGALKRHGLIDGSLRAPEPGAPFAYVTTKRFLEVFELASLRHLPDIERLAEEGLLQRPQSDVDLDGALGILGEEEQLFADAMGFDEADGSGANGVSGT